MWNVWRGRPLPEDSVLPVVKTFQITPALNLRKKSSPSLFACSITLGWPRYSSATSCSINSTASFGLNPCETNFRMRDENPSSITGPSRAR